MIPRTKVNARQRLQSVKSSGVVIIVSKWADLGIEELYLIRKRNLSKSFQIHFSVVTAVEGCFLGK